MLYIDIDGVLANTDKYILSLNPDAEHDTHILFKTMYRNYKTMFRESEPLVDLSIVKGFGDFTLLTALPLKEKIDSFCADDIETKIVLDTFSVNKRAWVKKYFGEDQKIIIVGKRSEKAKLCKGPADILIDDSDSNCKKWKEAGGQSYHSIDEYINRDSVGGVNDFAEDKCDLW